MSENIVGINGEKAADIMAELSRNRALLDACKGPHVFLHNQPPELQGRANYKCQKCGGVVNLNQGAWYNKALSHAQPILLAVADKLNTTVGALKKMGCHCYPEHNAAECHECIAQEALAKIQQ